MHHLFRLAVLAAGFGAAPALAQIYSCTVNGKTGYQDRPCQAAVETQQVVASDGAEPLVGCYDTDLALFKNRSTMARLKVSKVPGKGYVLSNFRGSSLRDNLPMSPASPQDLRKMRESIFIDVTHGLRSPDQGKPYGLYKGVDKKGQEVYYFYWRDDHANPFAKKVTCS